MFWCMESLRRFSNHYMKMYFSPHITYYVNRKHAFFQIIILWLCLRPIFVSQKAKISFEKLSKFPFLWCLWYLGLSSYLSSQSVIKVLFEFYLCLMKGICVNGTFFLFFSPVSFCLPQCLTHWCLHFYLFIKYSAAHYIVALPLFLNNTSNVHIKTLLLHWFSNVLR